MGAYRVLLISYDLTTIDALKAELNSSEFEILWRSNVLSALQSIEEVSPDLLLLDGIERVESTLQLCRSLRESEEAVGRAIVVLVSPDNEQTRLEALEAGADDSFSIASSQREKLLRLRAALRRNEPLINNEVLRYHDIELDLQRYKVRRRGAHVPLSTMQIKLLRHFMEHPNIVFSRKELLESVWEDAALDERAVDALIRRMRQILGTVGGSNVIRGVRGIGYGLDIDAGADS